MSLLFVFVFVSLTLMQIFLCSPLLIMSDVVFDSFFFISLNYWLVLLATLYGLDIHSLYRFNDILVLVLITSTHNSCRS